jgi:16S rRNA G966 N2-methylase RsmD
MADIKITDEIRAILDQCEFTETTVKLPNIQLDRKLYVKINAILEQAGGKWSKKEKRHVFPSDPKKKLGIIVEKGILIDEQKLFQKFYTPLWLVEKIVSIAKVEGKKVLEPSAGDGRVIDECYKQGASLVQGFDITDIDCKERVPTNEVIIQDFLTVQPVEQYDVILGNPPYSKNNWRKHTYHAYKFLKSGGKLVFVLPTTPHPEFYNWLSDKDYVVHEVKEGAFKEEGTMISVCILELNKK